MTFAMNLLRSTKNPIRNSSLRRRSITAHATLCFTKFWLAVIVAAANSASGREVATQPSEQQLMSAPRSAHWVSLETILLPSQFNGADVQLLSYPNGWRSDLKSSIKPTRFTLKASTISEELRERFPHLSNLTAYRFDAPIETKRRLVSEQLVVINDQGDVPKLAELQIGGAIDALFTAGKNDADETTDLGATISQKKRETQFKLWAPTAKAVYVQLFDDQQRALKLIPMTANSRSGIWQLTIDNAAFDRIASYYQYQVDVLHYTSGKVERFNVSDPYSLALSANGRMSMLVSLDDAATQPKGWAQQIAPTLDRPEQQIIYEAHIGDFSAWAESIPEADRASYRAFSYAESAPMKHLEALVNAGLNTFHLLPAYDIGTVNEKPAERLSLQSTVKRACQLLETKAAFCEEAPEDDTLLDVLKSYSQQSAKAQDLVEAINEIDDYNWGYDPVHYTVPDGSYASNADGLSRTIEFRQMVQTLHKMGLRVVMDVVYNHTYEAGQAATSVLDKIVPGYYHRLNPTTGAIEQSTCCENTATERVMMAKLMTDSLVVWARDYKIDGFRFDLMGHQPKAAMLAAREAVKRVDPDTYFYGEGWNFGEVANNAQFVQASQGELGGTSIGTFTDRLRDAIRGGSSFVNGDELRVGQGLGSGLLFAPNELNTDREKQTDQYNYYLKLARLGLAGNLKTFELQDRKGQAIKGAKLPYAGGAAGYALDPADTVNYVSKHDNQTLWDNNQYRLPYSMSADMRARLQLHGLSYPLMAQGIPFLHMGSELARSKSFLRDSYNFGHWFNRVDFTYQNNNYNVGLPPAIKDQANWPLIKQLVERNQGRDQIEQRHIEFVNNGVQDLLAIRSASPLFSLPTAQDIQQRVSFLNSGKTQQDGLIVMSIDDGFINRKLANLDSKTSQFVVIFNHSSKPKTFSYPSAKGLKLHPQHVKPASADAANTLAAQTSISEKSITTPAFSTVVLLRDPTP